VFIPKHFTYTYTHNVLKGKMGGGGPCLTSPIEG